MIPKFIDERGKEQDLVLIDKIDDLKGKNLIITLKIIRADNLPADKSFRTFCRYKWIDENESLHETQVIESNTQNPEFNYEKAHDLVINEATIKKINKSSLMISVFIKRFMVECLQRK